MSIIINHYGKVKSGEVVLLSPRLYLQNLLELEGKDIVIQVKERHKAASISQHGYYRGGILVSCYQSEMFSWAANKDEIHDIYFAPKFLSYVKVIEMNGSIKEVKVIKSLQDVSKSEMKEFITKVLAECNELGIEIPLPESYYNKYYQK